MIQASSLRFAARATGVLVWTATAFAVLEAQLLAGGSAESSQHLATAERALQRWCWGLLRLGGVDLCLRGAVTRPQGARLVVANHRSAYDIIILYALFGGSMLSRAEVAGWPVFGHAARRSRTIFVDRSSPHSGMRAIRSIRGALREGRSVTVFPEGGTFAGDELRAFAGGAFHAARGLDVEVVPVGLAYPAGTEYVEDAFVDHIANIAGNQHVPVGVAVGEPFKPHGAADHAVQKCESAVANLVQQARASIPPYARFVEPA